MNILVTKIEQITSNKSGSPVHYTKASYIDEKGSADTIFMSKDKFDALGFDTSKVVTEKEVAELFKTFTSCAVSFGKRGNVESLA